MSTPARPWWTRRSLVLTVVFLLVVAAVIVVESSRQRPVVTPPFAAQADPDPVRHPCTPGTPKTPLTVVASTEKAPLLVDMVAGPDARAYDNLPDRCADVQVEGIASGESAAKLRDTGRTGVRYGPADVWSPASSAWIGVATAPDPATNAPSHALGVVPDFGFSVTKTPLVFAVPRATAASVGWPDTEHGWGDLPVPVVGKTNPLVSTPGLLALLSTLRTTPGLPPDLDLARVSDPHAVEFARSIEALVTHYGDSEQNLLANIGAAPPGDASYAGAVPVEEKAVWDYNHDNPQAVPGSQSPTPRPESEQLAAITPAGGTYYSDSPFLVLNPQKQAAADDVRKWLLEPAQQQNFQSHGFRDVLGERAPELGPANGLSGHDPVALPLPPPAVVTAAQKAWTTWRKPANVLLVMDTSGSMNDPIPVDRPGPPRFDAVREAADTALDNPVGLGPGDQLAMWTFSSAPTPTGVPYQQVIPAGPVGSAVPAAEAMLDSPGLRLGGNTALYRTTSDAVATMRANGVYRPNEINAVVLLTDGAETEQHSDADPSREAQAVTDTLRTVAPTADRPVRIFYITYSPYSTGSKDNLSQIAQATGGALYDASDATTIDQIFTNVVSNF